MKKLILTGCAAAFFTFGMAQVQDTTSTNSNLRQGVQQTEERTHEDMNRAGNEFQRGATQAGDSIQRGAERTGNEMQQGAERTGESLQRDAESTGKEIQQGAERTNDQMQQGAKSTGDQMKQGAERVNDKMDKGSPSTLGPEQNPNLPSTDNSNMDRVGSTTGTTPSAPIEVLGDKEGPNNQVVYKYQGGLYYVDREQKKLVKIDESQLKDAEHQAIVSDKH